MSCLIGVWVRVPPGPQFFLAIQILKMKRFALIASLLAGALLFSLTIKEAGIDNVKNTILFFPASILIVVFLINFLAICGVGAWRWKIILESQNSHKINFAKVLRAKLAGFAISYLTPSVLVGGEPVRAYMIKEESDYGWEKSFASVIIDQAIYFFTLLLFMIAGFLFLADHFSLPREIFYGFGFIVLMTIFIFHLFHSRTINKNPDGVGLFMFIIKTVKLNRFSYIKNRESSICKTEKIIAQFFKNKKKAFIRSFFLAILESVLYATMIWIIVLSLGQIVNLTEAISIFFFITIANFIPIPGSLGSFEASLTFIFNLLELGKSNGFTFSLIYRFINIALVIVGFFALIYFEIKMLSRGFSREAPQFIQQLHSFLIKMIYKK